MNERLQELIVELAAERAVIEDMSSKMKTILDDTKRTQGFLEAEETCEVAKIMAEKTRVAIEELALEDFAKDQEKHPHEAIDVKMVSKVEIPDLMAVKEWCLRNYTPALKVDVKEIEKAAKRNNVPSNLATVTDEPKIYIASDLSKYDKEN